MSVKFRVRVVSVSDLLQNRDPMSYSEMFSAILLLIGRGGDGLARKEWRAFLSLSGFGLEAAWAFIAQGGMSPDGIIEAIDIAANGDVGLPA